MNVDMFRLELHIRLGGVLDGPRATYLLSALDRFRTGELILDFGGVHRFEPLGVEVLVAGLGRPRPGAARVRCVGLPARVAERLGGQEVAVFRPL